ncbi:MAG: hypothetical protein WBM51_09600, partial [Pseudolabrys sp.]
PWGNSYDGGYIGSFGRCVRVRCVALAARRLALMEKIMSKTNDTSNLATLEDHRPLADTELDAVTGGMLYLPGTVSNRDCYWIPVKDWITVKDPITPSTD